MDMCTNMFAKCGSDIEFCPPLRQLKKEHGPLREQMDAFREMAQKVGVGDGREDWSESLFVLRDKVERFVGELDLHSRREEDVLFDMMAAHIGREVGPIAVMEYEHDTAKALLKQFLQTTTELSGMVEREQAIRIADIAIQAEAILSQHFMKEEQVLFPMAEQILSEDEKQTLQDEMDKIK
ncbi:hemerythrin domain-containing protein [Brevibacillus migulae]|uniref:hemerythrin domain-containing protein n=1 Tax=Brevibacillus migulae TaxID=1644114 RepID=UPI001F303024|nr:hemerythrin domain-containing protein [Brevibacillus migulae]